MSPKPESNYEVKAFKANMIEISKEPLIQMVKNGNLIHLRDMNGGFECHTYALIL